MVVVVVEMVVRTFDIRSHVHPRQQQARRQLLPYETILD